MLTIRSLSRAVEAKCETYRHNEQRSDVEEAKVDHVEEFRVVNAAIRDANRFRTSGTVQNHRDRVYVYEFWQRIDRRSYPNAHNDQLRMEGKFIGWSNMGFFRPNGKLNDIL